MTDPHDLIRRRRYLSRGFVANEKIHLSKLGRRARSQKNMRDTYTVIHLFVLAYTDSIPQPRNCCSVYGECLGKTDGFARCDRFTAAAIRTLERANIDEMCSPHHLQAPRLASRDLESRSPGTMLHVRMFSRRRPVCPSNRRYRMSAYTLSSNPWYQK